MDNQISVLIICGPTSTGKTALALELSQLLPIEIISADSRQIYKGVNIASGVDIPSGSHQNATNLIWRDEVLTKYQTHTTSIWLQDQMDVHMDFNLSYWHECASLIIRDVSSRGLTPVVVGNTGLYIKSLTEDLSDIHIPQDPTLREKYQSLSAGQLYGLLHQKNSIKAESLNHSDKHNPRRLIRALEIANQTQPTGSRQPKYKTTSICLNCSVETAKKRIADRIRARVIQGIEEEAKRLLNCPNKNILNISGIKVWHEGWGHGETRDQILANWHHQELLEFKKQQTWFKNHSYDYRFDTDLPDWQKPALQILSSI